MSGRRCGVWVLAAAVVVVIAPCLPAAGALTGPGRPAGHDLTVDGPYVVSETEQWQNVLVKSTGSLTVPSGAVLTAVSISFQDGRFLVTGGRVVVVNPVPGGTSSISGRCSVFNLTRGASVTLVGPSGGSALENSTGGQASVKVDATDSIVVSGGSTIECVAGSARARSAPWTTSPLNGYVSAGGEALISLGGGSTPYIEVSGGSRLITRGQNGGQAADGRPGSGGTGGTGGGYSNGGGVGGHVGAGGDGRVVLSGMRTVLDDAEITCLGGRGGNAGRGGDGSTTSGSQYYYSSGGGGGGYGGGNGGSDYMSPGLGAVVKDFVGSGGAAVLEISAPELDLVGAVVTLNGGDGGSPGQGGTGGSHPMYPYYSGGGGGGGYTGGGGGSCYASGGAGNALGNVGAGGEANMSVSGGNLTIDGLVLRGFGGRPQDGARGGTGIGGGGGGGGYGGGGGGGAISTGGSGQTSGNVGSAGGASFVASGSAVRFVNSTVDLDGGAAARGGTGGNGGTYGGGGGGGFGGGGGAGYYNYNSPAGPGSCGQNVGRGGRALFRLSAGDLWANGSAVNVTGGAGGNAGAAGTGSGGGGGGGGYAGSGGGGWYGSGGEGTAGQLSGDGGEVALELYCGRGSIPPGGLGMGATGGRRGDGLTEKGSGAGGSGKGRATSDGPILRSIPRLVPIALGPPDGTMFNGPEPVLSWTGCLDGIIFPSKPDPVKAYGVALDDDPGFSSPELSVLDIPAWDRTFSPPALLGGQYYWRVCAVYSGGESPGWSGPRSFLKNGPPRLVADIPPLSFEEDGSLRHAVDLGTYFTDDLYPEDLSFEVAYEEDPALVHATIDGRWLDLRSMKADWHGTCDFRVRATDRGGISGLSNTFRVTVTAVNDAPFFTGLPVLNVTEDSDFRFDISPYVGDIDNGPDQLGLSVRSPHAVVEGHNITLHYSTEVGTDLLAIALTDGRLSAEATLEIRVIAVNDPPLALPVPDLRTAEDTVLELDLTPYGADEEDAPARLRWSVEGAGEGPYDVIVDGQNLLRLVPRPDASGEGVLVLAVSDTSNATSFVTVGVRVDPVNDPPAIKGLPEAVVKAGTPLKVDVKPYLSDVDSPPGSLRISVESERASVSGLVITLAYPRDERLGSETIGITVSDGQATGRGALSVRLLFPPLFTGAPDSISVPAGGSVLQDLSRFVFDREDGTSGLSWSLDRPDPGLLDARIDGNGLLSARSVGRDAAATNLTVTVTDLDGQSSSWTFDVRITRPEATGASEAVPAPDPVLPALLVAALLVGGSATFFFVSGRRARRN